MPDLSPELIAIVDEAADCGSDEARALIGRLNAAGVILTTVPALDTIRRMTEAMRPTLRYTSLDEGPALGAMTKALDAAGFGHADTRAAGAARIITALNDAEVVLCAEVLDRPDPDAPSLLELARRTLDDTVTHADWCDYLRRNPPRQDDCGCSAFTVNASDREGAGEELARAVVALLDPTAVPA